jgi:hypothetical protein
LPNAKLPDFLLAILENEHLFELGWHARTFGPCGKGVNPAQEEGGRARQTNILAKA